MGFSFLCSILEVTLEGILETLLGTEIMDETDNVSNLRRYAKQRWSRRLRKMGS